MATEVDTSEVKRMEWPAFIRMFNGQWRQGEHVGVIGPTGSGKTVIIKAIIPRRKHVAVFATKPEDSELTALVRSEGYKRISVWPPPPMANRVLLWPRIREDIDVYRSQKPTFRKALSAIFRQGRWCVVLDELRYVTDKPLKLQAPVELIWLQGRSVKISLVAATQRPAKVPLELYDMSTHLFFFRDNDETNLKRISGIGWRSSRLIREVVSSLPEHDVLYVNTRSGELIVTRVER